MFSKQNRKFDEVEDNKLRFNNWASYINSTAQRN